MFCFKKKIIKNSLASQYETNLDNNHKHFLDINHFNAREIDMLVDFSIYLKNNRNRCNYSGAFKNKTLAMIFEKNSLRTRISFDIGFAEMGGHTIYLNKNDIHLGEKEAVSDTSKVISKMAHLVMIRCYKHKETLLDFAYNSSVPVINGLTDYSHPCQIIAALSAFKNHFGKNYKTKTMLWLGAYNNVLLSYIQAAIALNINFHISCPHEYGIPEDLKKEIQNYQNIKLFQNSKEAAKNTDIIITDTWVSMNDNFKFDDIKNIFYPYQVNKEIMNIANSDAVFSHCLPAIRGQEVTADVIDSKASIVFSEAEFRLHSQKAIMLYICNLI